jgi:CMP/dCMP kinase
MNSKQAVVVAVDGPAASGKSTVSRAVAHMLGFNYVDSGAMYRTVTWKALEMGVNVEDPIAVVGMLRAVNVHFELVDGEMRMLVDGVNPGDAIRRPRVTEKVSVIAAIPEVRRVLVQHQRSLTSFGNMVMEGRDIGSVVFPDTPHKFYLDANPDVRARRRACDLEVMKVQANQAGVAQELQRRDKLDSTRQTAPLQIAPGATIVDNSKQGADAAAKIIVDHIRQQSPGLRSFGGVGLRRGSSSVKAD